MLSSFSETLPWAYGFTQIDILCLFQGQVEPGYRICLTNYSSAEEKPQKITPKGKPLTSVNTDACRTMFNNSLSQEQKVLHFIIFVCMRIQ